MLKRIFPLIFIAISGSAYSVEQITKITKLTTYGTYGATDTRYRNQIDIEVESPVVGCDAGFYLDPDDVVNNDSLVAFLLSAFHANSNVRFAADETQLLPGSKKYCRVVNISVVK